MHTDIIHAQQARPWILFRVLKFPEINHLKIHVNNR